MEKAEGAKAPHKTMFDLDKPAPDKNKLGAGAQIQAHAEERRPSNRPGA